MAPYTWELVQTLKGGRALFTQPPMPIKCAGAPQKAMYLACDRWRRRGVLADIDGRVPHRGPGAVRRQGVRAAADGLCREYGAMLDLTSNLKAVDGPWRKAWFEVKREGGSETVERTFDMLHVCPPQRAPGFVRDSALADAAGWIEVDPETLQHPRYANVFGLGDACSAPNAKTAAAVRKQAPVVALNVLAVLDGQAPRGALRRLWLLPADRRARQDRAGRVRLRRQASAHVPVHRRDQAEPARLAAQGEDAARRSIGS